MFQGSALIKSLKVQGSGMEGTPHQPMTDGGMALVGAFGLMEPKQTLHQAQFRKPLAALCRWPPLGAVQDSQDLHVFVDFVDSDEG